MTILEQLTHHHIISPKEVRFLLKLGSAMEDSFIEERVHIAVEEVEQRTKLGLQRRRLQVEKKAPQRTKMCNILTIPLPLGPVHDPIVTLVNTLTKATIPVPLTQYKLLLQGLHTTLSYHGTLPKDHKIQVIYEGGFTDPLLIPHGIKHSLLMLLKEFYTQLTSGEPASPHSGPSPQVLYLLRRYQPPRRGLG